MMEVAARETGAAGRARAALQHRLLGPARLRGVEVAPPAPLRVGDEGDPMASEARRHRAVEGVDAELDSADEVVDVADPQEVTGALGRRGLELLRRPVDHLVHLGLVLTERAA